MSDPATFNELLTHCTSVWLKADAEDHMNRVIAQGDMRPMSSSKMAMDDLRAILSGRDAIYSRANYTLDTSAQPLEETYRLLLAIVKEALSIPMYRY